MRQNTKSGRESECELAGPLLRKGSDVLVAIFILNQTVEQWCISLRWVTSGVNAGHHIEEGALTRV